MQGSRGGRDPFLILVTLMLSLGGLGGFGGQRSMLPSFFGGRDPFDDPFFTRPFGGMFESSIFGPIENPFTDAHASRFLEHQVPRPNTSRGPLIEELNSDDEKEEDKERKDSPRGHGRSSNGPYVEDLDDEVEGRKSKQMQYRNDFSRVNNTHSQPQTHSFTFQSSTVSYGGANGAYYSSSRTRTESDGLTFEESKEANKATGQATHQIARGIQDKGHMVTRKLNSDGRVDTMQALHNLNEDELSGFEEAWKGNARKHLPGWSEGFNMHDGSTGSDICERAGPSRSQHSRRMRADVGDRTGSSRERPRSAIANMDQTRRR